MNFKRYPNLVAVAGVAIHLSGAGITPLDAQVYEKVISFTDAQADAPQTGDSLGYRTQSLLEGPDGNFYGTTLSSARFFGNPTSLGTIFKMTPQGLLTTLIRFDDSPELKRGSNGKLCETGIDGRFYGITQDGGPAGLGSIFRMTRSGEFTPLVEFTGASGAKKGRLPVTLFQCADRNFYGMTSAGGASDNGTIFKMTSGGSITTLVEFTGGVGNRPGSNPNFLMQASDGFFYGTTRSGGAAGKGTIFKLSQAGEFTSLVDFTGTGGIRPGESPQALIEDKSGNIVGTTGSGGTSDAGTLFKISPTGVWSAIMNFGGTNGARPSYNLVMDESGTIYGLASEQGANGMGVIFKLAGSSSYSVLTSFPGAPPPFPGIPPSGTPPSGPLLLGRDGNLYGVKAASFTNIFGPFGEIYKATPAGDYSLVCVFNGDIDVATEGISPGNLIESSDGKLYGSTQDGGVQGPVSGNGTLFRVVGNQLETLVAFGVPKYSYVPANPHSGLILANDGRFYGTSLHGGTNGLGTVYSITAAGELSTLNSFNGNSDLMPFSSGRSDGLFPVAGLVQGPDSALYGRTSWFRPGIETHRPVIFRISTGGVMDWLRNPSQSSEGTFADVGAELIRSNDGNLYGIGNTGTIARASTQGDVSYINSVPYTVAPHGRLLETTFGGQPCFLGTGSQGGKGNGLIFKVSSGGDYTPLASLDDSENSNTSTVGWQNFPINRQTSSFAISFKVKPGEYNMDGVIGISNGVSDWYTDLACTLRLNPSGYFDAINGSSYQAQYVLGYSRFIEYDVVMTVNPATRRYSVTVNGNVIASNFAFRTEQAGVTALDTFVIKHETGSLEVSQVSGLIHPAHGRTPLAGLVKGSDGNFYGTASEGGAFGYGTVFKMSPQGVITKLVDFSGNGSSNKGSRPVTALFERGDGFFYGTTSGGGVNDVGTVFKMTPAGTLTTLFDFEADETDSKPLGALVAGPGGDLYGTTSGGSGGAGSVYRLVFSGPPAVFPLAAELDGFDAVLLHGKFNPRGSPTTVRVEYGTDGNNLVQGVTLVSALGGFQTVELSTTLAGLTRGASYYYRFRANSTAGEVFSPIQSFDTIGAPTVLAADATEIGSITAKINGSVKAGNAFTTVLFEYGTDGNSFPNSKSASPTFANGSNEIDIDAIINVTPGTTYFYRVVASNVAGTTVSGVRSFRSLAQPVVAIGAARPVSTTSVRVDGTVNAQGSSTQVQFEYGAEGTDFPSSQNALPTIVTGADDSAVTAVLPNLQQGVRYNYRIKATSAGGSVESASGTFTLDTLSGFAQATPGTPLSSQGFIIVNLSPPGIGGWRFIGEKSWRASGIPVGGFTSSDRTVEFMPVSGFIQPSPEPVSIVSGGTATFLNASYFTTGQPGSGGLGVTLKPDALASELSEAARGQWRLFKLGINTDPWLDSGVTLSGLFPGSYLIECKPVAGRATPPLVNVLVEDGDASLATITYFLEDPTTGAAPVVLPFETVSNSPTLPYSYVGQIRSDAGSSSGFVVKPRVVATAGHVVFDDGTLSLVTGLEWIFQRDSISHEPIPQVPRGIHLMDDYADARSAQGVIPGVGTTESQNRDAAALYFAADAGRGGYGGFLASDATENEFLISSAQKMLVGYPIDGISAANRGRMHATAPMNVAFTRVPSLDAFSQPFRTYTTPDIRGSGGISGGPLCVQFEGGSYYPAAIYLGGSNQTVVRAIDSKVIDLITRAETSTAAGDNNTDGGYTLSSFSTISGGSTQSGQVKVVIKPDAARSAGALWRVNTRDYHQSGVIDTLPAPTANEIYKLHLTPVIGFQPPDPAGQTLVFKGGKIQTITYTYVDQNDAPTISNVGNKSIDEDGITAAIPLMIGDVDDANISLEMTGSSTNTDLVPDSNIVFGGSGANRTVTITPAANQHGTTTITLTVSDGKLTADESFILTVDPVNDAPTISSIPGRSIGLNSSTGAIPFTIGDIDTAPGTLSLIKASSNTTLVPTANIVFGGSGGSRTATVTPVSGQLGSTAITVTVSDGSLNASRTFTLTVTGTARESWRFANFGTASDSGSSADSADADGDGSTNQDEYAAGTNPNNATDVFKILTSTRINGTFTVTAAGKASRSYVLERRSNLNSGLWTTIVSTGPLTADGPLVLTDSSPPADAGFYRLRVSFP